MDLSNWMDGLESESTTESFRHQLEQGVSPLKNSRFQYSAAALAPGSAMGEEAEYARTSITYVFR